MDSRGAAFATDDVARGAILTFVDNESFMTGGQTPVNASETTWDG